LVDLSQIKISGPQTLITYSQIFTRLRRANESLQYTPKLQKHASPPFNTLLCLKTAFSFFYYSSIYSILMYCPYLPYIHWPLTFPSSPRLLIPIFGLFLLFNQISHNQMILLLFLSEPHPVFFDSSSRFSRSNPKSVLQSFQYTWLWSEISDFSSRNYSPSQLA
jgi:hypothetical protein